MFLIIESGYRVEVCRALSPTESLDPSHHAARYAQSIGYALDTDNPCPTGLGADVDVTVQPTKKPGAVHVWDSKGFYFTENATQ